MPNAINLPRCTNLWTEQDRDLFNRLPVYMNKLASERLQFHSRHTKLLKPIKWQANMGNLMQGVRKVPSPILRAQAFPNPITNMPRKDVLEIRETSEQCQVHRQNFESNLLHFQPSFADFLTDHVDKQTEDISEKVDIYAEYFYRAAIFHAAPFVWICGKANGTELTTTNYWQGANISEVKNAAMLQALVAQCTKQLDLRNFSKIATVLHNDLRAVPYSGKPMSDGTDGSFLNTKFCMTMGTEVWDLFPFDSFLTANRKLDLDIVTGPFKGSLFGRWTTMHEYYELRIAADGTVPAPETIEENPNAYNRGEPIPNPAYLNAEFGVAFAYGNDAYKFLQIGGPPKDFANMTMKRFANLNWNGQVDITQNVLINCLNQHDAVIQDTNKRGEFIQLIADLTLGIIPVQRRHVVPIIYRRTRVDASN